MSQEKASLIAGLLAGIAGLLVFLVIHHFWIMPIWFITPIGLVIAAVGGLAVGWAYNELLPGLPRRPWSIFAWAALVSFTLTPAIIIAQLGPPLFTNAGIMNVTLKSAVIIFIVNLLLTATVTGGLGGWLIGRTKRAALSTALAGFVFALGPGHNIPFLGNTSGTGKGIALLVAIVFTASVVMVEGHAALTHRRFIARKAEIDVNESID